MVDGNCAHENIIMVTREIKMLLLRSKNEQIIINNLKVVLLIPLLLFIFSCNNNINNDVTFKTNAVTKIDNNQNERKDNSIETINEQETNNKFIIEIEEKLKLFPHIDGSTANIPLMAQIMSDYLNVDLEIAKNLTKNVSTTDDAWENLTEKSNGKNDIAIAYEPSKEIKQEIKESKNKLKIVPIGVDGFVFLRNKNNKVDSLTISDIQDIYSAKKLIGKNLAVMI